jgi:hypothetical protein
MSVPAAVPGLLEAVLAGELARPHAELEPLVAHLRARFGGALLAVLFYGSCRRSGNVFDGVVDLYAVLDARVPVERPLVAWLGGLLPPNVYFIEVPVLPVLPAGSTGSLLRAKVGVFTLAQLEAAACGLLPGVWGRLAQPMSLLFARDAYVRRRLLHAVARAVDTFARVAGRRPGEPPAAAWARGLAASYASELRVEGPDRAAALVEHDRAHYERLWAVLGPQPPGATWQWRLRARLGRLLSFLRLLKGLHTFDGALDYAAYKLSKHAGRRIDIPAHVRRHPWLHVWGFFVRLRRERVLR